MRIAIERGADCTDVRAVLQTPRTEPSRRTLSHAGEPSRHARKVVMAVLGCGELNQERTWTSEPPVTADPAGNRSGKTNRSNGSENLPGGRLIHDTDTGCIADQTSDRVSHREGGGLAEAERAYA